MDSPEPPGGPEGAPPAGTRAPVVLVAAQVLMWLLVAAIGWTAVVSAVLTAFKVSTDHYDAFGALSFIEPLLLLAAAVAIGLVAVKVWTGRDWARRAVVITSTVALATALVTRAGLTWGTGAFGTLLFAALLVLLAVPPARRWCDPGSERHSPRIGDRAEPPYLVVAVLLLLWTGAAFALYIGVQMVLATQTDLAGPVVPAWVAALFIALPFAHGALNVAFTGRREWGRIGSAALMLAYTAALAAAAVAVMVAGDPDALAGLAVLCIVPLAFAWVLLGRDARAWCRREA